MTFGLGLVRLKGFYCVGGFFGYSSSSTLFIAPLVIELEEVMPIDWLRPPVSANLVWSSPVCWVIERAAAVEVDLPVARFSIVRSISATFGRFFSTKPMIFSSI